MTEEQAPFAPLASPTESGSSEILMGNQPMPNYVKVAKPVVNMPQVPENQSPWPKVIAIAAAFEGNFNPLFELSEQKRKTQVYNSASKLLHETYNQMNQGNTEEAIQKFQEGITQLGGRAHEIGQFMAPEIARMSKIQQDLVTKNNLTKYMKAQANLVTNENTSKQLKNVAALLDSIKQPLDTATMKELVSGYLKPEVRYTDERIIRSFPYEDTITEIPTAFTRKDLPEFVAQSLQSEFGMTPPEVIDVMKDIPKLNSQGENITPLLKEALRYKMQGLSAQVRDIELQKNIPKPAEFNQVLQGVMVNKYGENDALLRMTTGKVSAKEYQEAQDRVADLWYRRNAAQIYATNELDPFAPRRAGLRVRDKDSNSPSFGQEVFVPYNTVKENQDRFGMTGQESDQPIYEGLKAVGALRQIDEVFKAYSEEGLVNSAMARAVAERFGISLTPQTTASTLAEAIANDAIEKVLNSTGASRKEIGDVKKFVTGKFADPSTAKASRAVLEGRLRQQLGVHMNNEITIEGKEVEKRIKEAPPAPQVNQPPLPEGASGKTKRGVVILPK